MKDYHYYNPRLLYAECGPATKEQLQEILINAIHQTGHAAEFSINIVCGRKGSFGNGQYGFAYIWITNPIVGYILSGMNPDGTERIETSPDPEWKAPKEALEIALSNRIKKEKENEPDYSVSVWESPRPASPFWSDLVSETEEEVRMKYVCPTITRKLPSLVELSTFDFNEEQYEILRSMKYQARNDMSSDDRRILCSVLNQESLPEERPQWSEYSDYSDGEDDIPLVGHIIIESGYIKIPSSTQTKNVLFCKSVPDFVTPDMLKQVFAHFATDRTKILITRQNGKRVSDTYPTVNIVKSKTKGKGKGKNSSVKGSVVKGSGDKSSGGNMAFITFDPETVDGSFALTMTRKLELIDPKTGTNKTIVLNHTTSR